MREGVEGPPAAIASTAQATDVRRRSPVALCVVLFLLAVLCRLAYLRVFGVESQEGGDMGEYIALARHLVAGDGFTSDGATPGTYRPPLFSCLLAAWCWLLRDTGLGTLIAFQVVAQSLAAPLAYLLVRGAQRSHAWAIGCGLLMSAYPYLISTVSLVLQEPTLAVVATLLGLGVTWWCRSPTNARAAAVGLCLGACALAKSPFLAGLIVVPAVCWGFRRHEGCPPLRQAGLAVAMALALILPWTLRNALVTGRFVPINDQGGGVVIWLVADGKFDVRESLSDPLPRDPDPEQGVGFTYGNVDGLAYLRGHNEDLLRRGLSGDALERGLEAASRSYLARHPFHVLRLVGRGTILHWAPYAVGPLRKFLPARLAAMVLIHLPLALGFVLGLVRSVRRRSATIAMLALIVTLYLLAHTTLVVEGGRHLASLLPLIMAIAGYGFFGGGVGTASARGAPARS